MYAANNNDDQRSNQPVINTVIHARYLLALKSQRREALIQGAGYGVAIASFCWYFVSEFQALLL